MTAIGDAVRVQDLRGAAVEILCSNELSDLVDLVFWSPTTGVFEAQSVDGHIRFRRDDSGRVPLFTIESTSGRDPLADQDPARFTPLAEELSHPNPDRSRNSYPYAFEHISQVFDHPCAPDLCVLHTSSHQCEDHRGEHGSLGVVQSRAPLIMSGAGVAHAGLVDRHCRLVDVALTVLALLGVRPAGGVGVCGHPRSDAYLSRQDGEIIEDLMDPGSKRPERVVAFLLDGANPNMLYDMAVSGDAPTLSQLISRGTAFRHGAIASYPTVTLPNHTTLLTGCHPGHHGVLNNAWYDRELRRQIITESPSTWQEAMQWLTPGVQTIHEALVADDPGAVTLSVNEPADRGAGYSTFDLFRTGLSGELASLGGSTPSRTTQSHADSSKAYRWGSTVDASAVNQACALLEDGFAGIERADPKFLWVNTSLTDATSHEDGPHSEIARDAVRDTDSRIGDVLAAVEKRFGLDRTTVVVVADHGMELNDPAVRGDWGDALRQAGISFRDEASGFLYFGV